MEEMSVRNVKSAQNQFLVITAAERMVSNGETCGRDDR